MKTLFYALLLLTFIGCKKEEMDVTPEYSFVRLNDETDISPCYTQSIDCLPVADVTDLRFQVVTDFSSGVPIDDQDDENFTLLIALPCDVCNEFTDNEIYEMVFGDDVFILDFDNSDDGHLIITTVGEFAQQAVIGQWVYLSGTGTYAGFHKVLDVDTSNPPTVSLTLDVEVSQSASVGQKISLISDVMIMADVATQIADDAEFSGDNYIWDLHLQMNTLNTNDGFVRGVTTYADGQCFKLCVYRLIVFGVLDGTPIFVSADCLGSTNCFAKISDICYTTKLTYGNNEDSFGFYTDGTNPFEMSVRLHLWFYAPKYPGEENGYQRSDGQFVKLSERINKTWEMETDYFPEQIHERLRIALSCDNITVTNENAQMTEVDIYRNAEYSIEWNDDVKNYPFAKGKTTVFKQLLSRSVNSNCA